MTKISGVLLRLLVLVVRPMCVRVVCARVGSVDDVREEDQNQKKNEKWPALMATPTVSCVKFRTNATRSKTSVIKTGCTVPTTCHR